MLRACVSLSFVIILLSSLPGFCQGIPGWGNRLDPNWCAPGYLQPKPCGKRTAPPPMVRTVQVSVPVPCQQPPHCMPVSSAPPSCLPPMGFPPRPCVPPVCSPPCPTRPVNVRVEVRVRPEAPKPCVPKRYCCMNPPVFEPFFCRAAGMLGSILAAPLALGEMFMGHPVPMPLPAPTPIPCWRAPAGVCPAYFQPQPPQRCMPGFPAPVACAPPGPPAKVRPSCIRNSAGAYQPNSPFPR